MEREGGMIRSNGSPCICTTKSIKVHPVKKSWGRLIDHKNALSWYQNRSTKIWQWEKWFALRDIVVCMYVYVLGSCPVLDCCYILTIFTSSCDIIDNGKRQCLARIKALIIKQNFVY